MKAQVQGDDQSGIKEYQELIEYRQNFTIIQEQNEESFGKKITGVERKTPDKVFLAEYTELQEPGELPLAETPVYQLAYTGTLSSQSSFSGSDVSFDDTDGDGSGTSLTGRIGPGCGGGIFNFW